MEVDVSNASVTSEISLLGCDGDIMYQNADNIFVAKTDYTYDYSEETVDGVTREVSKNRSDTVLAKISVEGGLALVGSARIDENGKARGGRAGRVRGLSARRDEHKKQRIRL